MSETESGFVSSRPQELDHRAVERIVGTPLAPGSFEVDEDHGRALHPGVFWRRRRFRFLMDGQSEDAGLCVNELTVDPQRAELVPVDVSEHEALCELDEVENAYWATTWAQGAIRVGHGIRDPRLYVNVSRLACGTVAHGEALAEHLRAESLRNHAPDGLRELAQEFSPLEAHYVEGHNPTGPTGIVRYYPAIPPSRYVQSEERVLAGAAAGFYANFPEEYGDGYTALHQPLGALVIGGRLRVPAWIRRPAWVDGPDGAMLTMLGPESMVLVLEEGRASIPLHVGNSLSDGHGAVWRRWDSAQARRIPEGGAQLLFSGCQLVQWGPIDPHTKPPIGGGVVWVTGYAAQAVLRCSAEPPRVKLALTGSLGRAQSIVSASPIVLRDGRPIVGDALLAEEYAGEFGAGLAPPARFPYDAATTRAPRTVLGRTAHGSWKLLVIDGRRAATHSLGLTLEGLGQLALAVGCVDALNLDGGGSACLALEGVPRREMISETSALGVVNVPSDKDGRERILPVLLAVRTLD